MESDALNWRNHALDVANEYYAKLWAECESLKAELKTLKAQMPRNPFDVRCADALADEVAVLIRRRLLDSRSPAGDALLDYRNPPTNPRVDRLARLDETIARLTHQDHGRGEDEPDDPDCPCRPTPNMAECAQQGCGFCRAENLKMPEL
jgi:hypothetical protein